MLSRYASKFSQSPLQSTLITLIYSIESWTRCLCFYRVIDTNINFMHVSSDFAQSACMNIILLRSRDIIFAISLYIPARIWRANYCFSGPENALYRIFFFRILACCCFYFPTTMVLMYCYGSAFHVNKLRLKRVVCVNTPEVVSGGHIERVSQVYSLCEWNSNRQPICLAIIDKTIPSNMKGKYYMDK